MNTDHPDSHLVIKVNDNKHRCYFVHFDRASRDLIDVREYHTIYLPGMGVPSVRIQSVLDSARSGLSDPANKEMNNEDHV